MSKQAPTETVDRESAAPPAPGSPAGLHARTGVSEGYRTMPAIPTARVNLMPPDVLLSRRVRRVQRRILAGAVAVVLCVLAGLAWFTYDASQATAGLGAERAAAAALKQEQQAYAELLRIDLVTGDIDRSLARVMGDDVDWDRYLEALDASAPSTVELTGVSVLLSDIDAGPGEEASTPAGSLDSSGEEHVGALTVTGLAPSHEVVAGWVQTMTDTEGFLVPYILGTSVVVEGTPGIQFTVEITLGSAVRSLRYATVPTSVEQD